MPGSWWWLSFADEDKFKGVAIVGPANTVEAAVLLAHQKGINPGGSVAAVEIPSNKVHYVPKNKRDRLLGKAEASTLDAFMAAQLRADNRLRKAGVN